MSIKAKYKVTEEAEREEMREELERTRHFLLGHEELSEILLQRAYEKPVAPMN